MHRPFFLLHGEDRRVLSIHADHCVPDQHGTLELLCSSDAESLPPPLAAAAGLPRYKRSLQQAFPHAPNYVHVLLWMWWYYWFNMVLLLIWCYYWLNTGVTVDTMLVLINQVLLLIWCYYWCNQVLLLTWCYYWFNQVLLLMLCYYGFSHVLRLIWEVDTVDMMLLLI